MVSTNGVYKWYQLLRRLPKDDYLHTRSTCGKTGNDWWNADDYGIYVDLKTHELWFLTGDLIPAAEFEKKVVELGLESGAEIDIEASKDLVNLEFLRDTIVEWWCK